MSANEKPVILTSLDPSAGLAGQQECFGRWQEAGFEVVSVNAPVESGKLRDEGVTDAALVVSDRLPVSRGFFGEGRPRVDELLRLAADRFPDRDVMICKPGVYPAIRDASIVEFLGKLADVVGLTGELCHRFENYQYTDCTPGRTDLAAIFVRSGKAASLDNTIRWEDRRAGAFSRDISWTERLVRLIRDRAIDGMILDSGVLLERIPDKTVDCVEFFAQCMFGPRTGPRLPGLDNRWRKEDDFRYWIDETCCDNAEVTDQLRLIYFSHGDAGTPGSEAIRNVREIAAEMQKIVPDPVSDLDILKIARLLESAGGEAAGMPEASSVFATSGSQYHRFSQTLLAIGFMLRVPGRMQGAAQPGAAEAVEYRVECLETLTTTVQAGAPEYRLRVAQVFGSELLETGHPEKWLAECLIAGCENERERSLVKDICESARREIDVASAN